MATNTIPERLNQRLDQMSVGKALLFAADFKDELPADTDGAEILRMLGEAQQRLDGIVDLPSGTIIAISKRRRRRIASYLMEIGVLVAGGLIAYLAVGAFKGYVMADTQGVHVSGATAAAYMSALIGVMATFVAGAGFHFIIDLLKARGSVGWQEMAALDDWLLWLHAREVKLMSSFVGLWVVFGAVVIGFTGATTLDPSTAFFAGYSFDSLIDVVVKRFGAFAPAPIEAIQKRLTGTAMPANQSA